MENRQSVRVQEQRAENERVKASIQEMDKATDRSIELAKEISLREVSDFPEAVTHPSREDHSVPVDKVQEPSACVTHVSRDQHEGQPLQPGTTASEKDCTQQSSSSVTGAVDQHEGQPLQPGTTASEKDCTQQSSSSVTGAVDQHEGQPLQPGTTASEKDCTQQSSSSVTGAVEQLGGSATPEEGLSRGNQSKKIFRSPPFEKITKLKDSLKGRYSFQEKLELRKDHAFVDLQPSRQSSKVIFLLDQCTTHL